MWSLESWNSTYFNMIKNMKDYAKGTAVNIDVFIKIC